MSSGLLYLALVGVWVLVLVPMWVRRSDAREERARSGEAARGWWSAFRRSPGGAAARSDDAAAEADGAGTEEAGEDGGARTDAVGTEAAGGAEDRPGSRADRASTPDAVQAAGRGDRYPRRRRATRARIVARRRRRLTGICLLLLVAAALAGTGVARWWVVPVPGALLLGYLACLRGASQYDRELRARRRAEAAREPARRRARTAAVVPGPGVTPSVAAATVGSSAAHASPAQQADERDELFDQYAPPARAVGE